MNLNYIDKKAFRSATGADYSSTQGLFFRKLAIKNIIELQSELNDDKTDDAELIHKLKGISSSCGALLVARVCAKLEQYKEVVNKKHVKKTLNACVCTLLGILHEQ